MRIGNTPSAAQTGPAPKAKAAQAPTSPAMQGDFFSKNPDAVNVVCFNVAGGASAFKLEEKLIDSPVFQKVVQGSPDAPIVACQEMTPALAKALIAASKNGNFEVIWPGQAWLPSWVPTSTLMQGNLLLVPKRYQVEKSEGKTFAGRAGQFFKAVKGVLFGDKKPNELLLALQNRGYVSASLKDTRTGKQFNVFGTHIPYHEEGRRQTTPQLVEAINQAKGPTVVMGDVNVASPDPSVKLTPGAAEFWKTLEPLGLKDMGPTGEAAASYWKNGANIDVVLAKGFKSESSKMLTGSQNTLPGRKDAREISDHYAEADALTFE